MVVKQIEHNVPHREVINVYKTFVIAIQKKCVYIKKKYAEDKIKKLIILQLFAITNLYLLIISTYQTLIRPKKDIFS